MNIIDFLGTLPQIFFTNLADSAVLALATLGIVLIYRTSFTTNFSQGMIASFSAYVMYTLSQSIFFKSTLYHIIYNITIGSDDCWVCDWILN